MVKNNFYKNRNHQVFRGQAIVEFAIALPVLLLILFGLFEVGRLIFIYSAITNASREAARYGSAVGLEDTGQYHKYLYCDGIKQTAINSAFLLRPADLTISISYDDGPGTSSIGTCTVTGGESTLPIESGDRVKVTVTAQYRPMVKLVPIKPRTFTSTSARTIFGIVELDP